MASPVARPPDGVDHHYTPLAILTAQSNAAPMIDALVATSSMLGA